MYYVYILTNHTNTTLYTGSTYDLHKRMWEHKHVHLDSSFVQKYSCYKLVYFEHAETMDAALFRENQIKNWTRARKDKMINTHNPEWKDLSLGWR